MFVGFAIDANNAIDYYHVTTLITRLGTIYMKTFTIEKLKRNPNAVLEEVRDGAVQITHRDRRNLILVMQDHYEHLQERAAQSES